MRLFFLLFILLLIPQPVYSQQEDTSQWSENSRLFSEGSRTIQNLYLGPVNYQAPWKGVTEWTRITPNWLRSNGPWDYVSTGVEYDVKVLTDLASGQIIEWSLDGSYLRFQPMALQWTNSLNQIDQISMPSNTADFFLTGETISFDNAYGPGTKLSWSLENTRLRKELIIGAANTLPEPASYILEGENPQLELNLIFSYSNDLVVRINGLDWNGRDEIDTAEIVEFRKNGELFFAFVPPLITDFNENTSIASLRFKKSGNSLYISVRVPKAWLDSAVYPIRIDPTLDLVVGAGADDIAISVPIPSTPPHVWTVCAIAQTTGYIGFVTPDVLGIAFRFPGVTLPQGSIIDVAYLSVYSHNAQASSPVLSNIYVENVDNALSYTGTCADVNSRVYIAPVTWDNIIPFAGNVWYNSPSLVTRIQAVINRPGFTSGNALGISWEDDGTSQSGSNIFRRVRLYDHTPSFAAKLHLEWSSPLPPTPEPVSLVSLDTGPGISMIVYAVLLLGFIIIGFAWTVPLFFLLAIFVLIPLMLVIDVMMLYIGGAGLAAALIFLASQLGRNDNP